MTEIKLDIDEKLNLAELVEKLEQRMYFIRKEVAPHLVLVKICSTTKGYHIYLNTGDKRSDYEVILIQALLGSDWRREIFNYRRVRRGQTMQNWNILFVSKHLMPDGTIEKKSEEKDITKEYRFTRWLHKLVGSVIRRLKL